MIELVYPASSAVFGVIAVRAWARWARRGGRWSLLLGVTAWAVAVDATRSLLFRVNEVPGGGPRGLVTALVVASAGWLLFRAWQGLPRGTREGPGSSRSQEDAPGRP